MIRTTSVSFLIGLVLLAVNAGSTVAQEQGEVGALHDRVDFLERQIDQLGSRVGDGWEFGLAILFGAFCALWAQNTGRNPWLWFCMGALFSCITVPFLLAKNANDLAAKATPAEPESVGFQDEDGS